jgi:hypothetical protein
MNFGSWVKRTIMIYLIFLMVASSLPVVHPQRGSALTCTPSVDPFTVTGSSWVAQTQGVGPGDSNAQLTIELTYSGGCPVTSSQFQLTLQRPFYTQSGQDSESYYLVNIPSYAQIQVTYSFGILSNATTGTYQLPLYISYSVQNATGFSEDTQVSVFLLGSVQLELYSSTPELVPGQINNVIMTVQNLGSGNATDIDISLLQPLQGISVLGQLPSIPILGAGGSYIFQEQLYVSNSVAGQPITLPLAVSYTNPYGQDSTQQFLLGLYVESLTSVGQPISISVVSPYVYLGQSSTVEIKVTDTGATPILSPSFILSVPAGFAVLSNSTYSIPGVSIPAGGSFTYAASIISGPKTPEGAYSAQFTISYFNSLGQLQTITIPAGFVAIGRAVLQIQGMTYSVSDGVLSVGGTLLNEGTSSAFYLQLSASVVQNGVPLGQGASYVGEVDPNTPIPFSVQVPVASSATNGTATLNINMNYLNDYGQQFNQSVPPQSFQLSLGQGATSASSTAGGGVAQGRIRGEFFLLSISLLIISVIIFSVALYTFRKARSKGGSYGVPNIDQKVI